MSTCYCGILEAPAAAVPGLYITTFGLAPGKLCWLAESLEGSVPPFELFTTAFDLTGTGVYCNEDASVSAVTIAVS